MALGSILASMAIAFIGTYFITPKFIIFLEKIGLTGIDQQKSGKPKIAEMGGPAILFGFLGGIFLFIWLRIFLFGGLDKLGEVFAGISTIVIISLIGMFDDLGGLMKLRSKEIAGYEKRIGLKQWQKPLLTLLAAVPLMATMTGNTTMSIPIIGTIDFGIFYPLIIVPIAVVGASNATNMLAGINGVESGMGVALLGGLGIYGILSGKLHAAAIALIVASALLAFLRYNWYPAKIFPGDSATYMIGATVAVVAVVGEMQKFAVFCFILWFFELLLKARGRFSVQSFGELETYGSLKAPKNTPYSLLHVFMLHGKFTEKQIASILILLEVIFVVLALLIFYFKIFDPIFL